MEPSSVIDRKPKTATRYDFARMLRQMKFAGYTVDAIAMHANVSASAVRNYMATTVPLHPNGERIIALWCDWTGNPRAMAPVMTDIPAPRVTRYAIR